MNQRAFLVNYICAIKYKFLQPMCEYKSSIHSYTHTHTLTLNTIYLKETITRSRYRVESTLRACKTRNFWKKTLENKKTARVWFSLVGGASEVMFGVMFEVRYLMPLDESANNSAKWQSNRDANVQFCLRLLRHTHVVPVFNGWWLWSHRLVFCSDQFLTYNNLSDYNAHIPDYTRPNSSVSSSFT